jgi:Uma2 family endonuclease
VRSIPEPVAELARPITRVEYARMLEAGVFGDDHVELLYGVIVWTTPRGASHDATTSRLEDLLTRALPSHLLVRAHAPFAATDASQPEPDIAVVPAGEYDDAHPSTALLIVEVAASSLRVDRGAKARLYAECSVPEYWVVDVGAKVVEAHTDLAAGHYRRITPHRAGDTIDLVALPGTRLELTSFLR